MPTMRPEYLVGGTAVLLLSVIMAIGWKQTADIIQRWGVIMSDPEGRPWWRRGHFRPGPKQAAVVAWLLILATASLGAVFLAVGLGLDLGKRWD